MIAKNVYAKNENRNERFFKRFSCRNLQFLFVHLIFLLCWVGIWFFLGILLGNFA